MGQEKLVFTIQGYLSIFTKCTKSNGFKGRARETHFKLASSIGTLALKWAVKILDLVPAPEPLEHTAQPVLLARLTGISEG